MPSGAPDSSQSSCAALEAPERLCDEIRRDGERKPAATLCFGERGAQRLTVHTTSITM
jgi:hypothetical protein